MRVEECSCEMMFCQDSGLVGASINFVSILLSGGIMTADDSHSRHCTMHTVIEYKSESTDHGTYSKIVWTALSLL